MDQLINLDLTLKATNIIFIRSDSWRKQKISPFHYYFLKSVVYVLFRAELGIIRIHFYTEN